MSNANAVIPVVSNDAASSKKPHKKKATKHKSRNDFSDVQRIELHPSSTPTTTMDLLKSATDLNDLSQKLDERLTLATATNGDGGGGGEPPNIEQEQSDSSPPSDIPEPSCVEEPPPPPPSIPAQDPSSDVKIEYREYESELQMPDIIRLIQRDLSEPYSIYTYRYFIHNWPELCFLAMHDDKCVGAIVCKLGMHRQIMKRGYIAMLAVDKEYRKLKIGTNLVQKAIEAMLKEQADEVVLETEITNTPALRLYENLGFVRDKRLFHYYLNGVDALRLKLWFR